SDARGLSDGQMQALAREMNLSETTFVFPDESSGGAVKVRIFTVQEELPFAGHPTLGTAFALRSADAAKPAKVTLELKVGKVPVEFSRRDGMEFGEMRQREPEFGAVFPRDEVAAAIGIAPDEMDDRWPIQ